MMQHCALVIGLLKLSMTICALRFVPKKIQVSHGLFSVDLLEHLASHGARGLSYLILFSFFMTIILVGFCVLCISLRTGSLGVRGSGHT